MRFNPDIHNRQSIRLQNYDYASGGAYYVTLCSKNRDSIFSRIHVGAGLAPAQVELTAIGKIIDKNWRNIHNEYANIDIDEFIIMPNHLHGILFKRATARVAPTLGQIIGKFKSKCSTEYLKYIYENNINDIAQIWQRNYYEHIIRSKESLEEIRKYIVNNPFTWESDEENKDANNKIPS